MTTITHPAGDVPLSQGRIERFAGLFARLLVAHEALSESRRQRLALERFDNRLRDDIGLPPRNDRAVLRIGASSTSPF